MNSENLFTIKSKMKRLALGSGIAGFAAIFVFLICLLFFADLNILAFGIGLGISFVFVIVWCFIFLSVGFTWAAEIINDASRLAKAAYAMAAGDFSATFRPNAADELGQIEGALAQIAQVNKGLAKDIDAFAKRHTQGDTFGLIDEKHYVGEYRDLILAINNTVSRLEMKSLDASNELESLRKNLDALQLEFKASVAATEAAREETSLARRDIATANAEAAAAKREASFAKRESERAAAQLKSASASRLSKVSPPASKTMTVDLQKPQTKLETSILLKPPVPKLTRHDSASAPFIRVTKSHVPSGAHEYDSKDFGKF